MPLDYERILALPPVTSEQHLTTRDTMLYALGLGAHELPFVYERELQALPTIAAVLASPSSFLSGPEYGVTWQKVLHGEQSIEIHQPLPVQGLLVGETVVEAIMDKGRDKGAVMRTRRTIRDRESGNLLATTWSTGILLADGGFGQHTDVVIPSPYALPDRPSDLSLSLATRFDQAMLYRLSGDYNPLHIDPDIARTVGFDRPILHGLCTYGIAGRALIQTLCNNDGARLKRMDARFSKPVYPGDTIRTDIWREGEGRAAFQSFAVERGELVLNNGYVEFR